MNQRLKSFVPSINSKFVLICFAFICTPFQSSFSSEDVSKYSKESLRYILKEFRAYKPKAIEDNTHLPDLKNNIHSIKVHIPDVMFGHKFMFSPHSIYSQSVCMHAYNKEYLSHLSSLKEVLNNDNVYFIESQMFVLRHLINYFDKVEENKVSLLSYRNLTLLKDQIRVSYLNLNKNTTQFSAINQSFSFYYKKKCEKDFSLYDLQDYYLHINELNYKFIRLLETILLSIEKKGTVSRHLFLNLFVYYSSFEELLNKYHNKIDLIHDLNLKL